MNSGNTSAPDSPQKRPAWRTALGLGMITLTLLFMLRADLSHLAWVSNLAKEGSPPPAFDLYSPSGYERGQHYFIGSHERGATYRWITVTQALGAQGPAESRVYGADNVPTGRRNLLPQLEAGWLATVSWGVHQVSGESFAVSVERAALWEPVICHLLALLAVVAVVWRGHGMIPACLTGLFFVLFPPLAAQFLPGVLTTRTAALMLATYSLALHLPPNRGDHGTRGFGIGAALATSAALWLEPAVGFPVVLLSTLCGAAGLREGQRPPPFLRWSLVGALATLAAWAIDQAPWDLAAGELRYVHPLYALAWLGCGLCLDGGRRLLSDRKWKLNVAESLLGLGLLGGLFFAQIAKGYQGWIYPASAMRRLTSLDETLLFHSFIDWLGSASLGETSLLMIPLLAAGSGLIVILWQIQDPKSGVPYSWRSPVILFVGVAVLTLFRVRWCVVAELLAFVMICGLVKQFSSLIQRAALVFACLCLAGMATWSLKLPASLQQPSGDAPPSPADLDVLLQRHFSQWLTSHTPKQDVVVLAPPEFSDSLVFHGGVRVLMSTAWEAYEGQVAASRILSAPESSEAEAVLGSRKITHLVLPSWDTVLPLLVRAQDSSEKGTLYARLQRWVFPPYLRPVAYHLPALPGYADKNLLVYKVTPTQDEALSLSRLAEYFVEMNRADLAALVLKVLVDTYRDDPNAAIARALVYAQAKQGAEFERELNRLVADVAAGRAQLPWDRRVQRAIVLAIGHRADLARKEVEACLVEAAQDDPLELTPLEAFRLRSLVQRFGVEPQDKSVMELLGVMGSEYAPAKSP